MGSPTAQDRSETTRLLCANAVLGDQSFRAQVLDHLHPEGCGFAPEIGLDVDLLGRMCKRMESRYRSYSALLLAAAAVVVATGLLGLWWVAGATLLAMAAVHVHRTWSERKLAREFFARGVYDPERVRSELVKNIALDKAVRLPVEDQNLVVYRDFTPFVGAGQSLDELTFVVDISKSREGSEGTRSFGLEELVSEIRDRVNDSALPGLDLRQIYFIHGSDVRSLGELLPNEYECPVQHVPDSVRQAVTNTNGLHVREYQRATVTDFGRELVVSDFLRLSLQGKVLFVENNRYLLAPIDSRYRGVDALKDPSFISFAESVMFSVIIGPLSAFGALVFLAADAKKAMNTVSGRRSRLLREGIDRDPFYNYGAANSLRGKFAGRAYTHYFQKKDSDFFQQMLLKVVLDAVVEFLDRHDIDTSDLRERKTMILNSGIIVHGGDVKAESLAVGTGAAASSSRVDSGKAVRSKKDKE
jgi:hypothetical protein